MKKKIGSSKPMKKYKMAGQVEPPPTDDTTAILKKRADISGNRVLNNDLRDASKNISEFAKRQKKLKEYENRNKPGYDETGKSKFSKMLGFKKGGTVGSSKKPKMAKGGSVSFGMLSVKAGIDKNPKATAADRIAGATMKKGGIVGKSKKK